MTIEGITTAAKVVAETGKEGIKKAGKGIKNKIPDFNKSDTLLSLKEKTDSPAKSIGIKDKIPDFIETNGFLPKTGGEWEGERGNSKWIPASEETPQNPLTNPDKKTWKEILDENKTDGINFNDGEPDFSEISEGTVEIDDYSINRNDNFTQADEKLAEKWTEEGKGNKEWTPQDIRNYRKENNLTWHERNDMKTMDLVPTEIHGNIPHQGGISVLKEQEREN